MSTPPIQPLPRSTQERTATETIVTCPQCGHHFVPVLSGASPSPEVPQILDEQLLRKSLSQQETALAAGTPPASARTPSDTLNTLRTTLPPQSVWPTSVPLLGLPIPLTPIEQLGAFAQTSAASPGLPPELRLPDHQHLTAPPPTQTLTQLFDHPQVGGRFTIFCLCYGDHLELHQRCLNSILQYTPLERIELRVAANQVGAASRAYLESLPIRKIYWDEGARRKYPAMREMFWDESCPIETRWVIWFDDDSHVLRSGWLQHLCGEIIRLSRQDKPDDRLGMLGRRYYHVLRSDQGRDPKTWFREGRWHRGRPFADAERKESLYGNVIHFLAGSFWALRTDALRECDIPDPRLEHHGGDIVIGEQLWQHHWRIENYDSVKQFVQMSDAPPRGVSVSGNSLLKFRKLPWYALG